jgi:hypothetical protein
MTTYKVTDIADPSHVRSIDADGFYLEDETHAVCLYTGTRGAGETLVARLFNVNVEPESAE